MNAPADPHAVPHDPYASLRIRNFRRFLGSSVLANVGMQMQSIAVLWEIYDRTKSASAIGTVGLVQVLPVIVLSIAAGHAADRFPRRWVIAVSMALAGLGSLALLAVSLLKLPIGMMYGSLFLIAIGRAFHQPAKSALLPQVVPRALFSSAVSWSMTGFQLSSALGPALGGFLIAATKGPAIVYLLTAISTIAYAAIMLTLSGVPRPEQSSGVSLRSLVAGFSFVWRHPIVLPALALDLFAVLLGGATSMLPVYAKTILYVDATGLGFLDAAPAVGAMAMAIYMAHRPPLRHAGRDLLWAVAMFGVATIVFGLSRNFYLSLAMLFCTGAVDNISVIVRHTLVQMLTPDRMRGRVSAVNGMFIGASNELGTAESGFVASYTTPQISVVSGGVGTLLVVAVVALLCTQLRRYGRLGANSAVGEAEAAPRGTHHPAAAAMGANGEEASSASP
ncbi:MAG TPA: MFS transporter [Pirellulales bacterium]|jgi:MFS family permease|nr:MFS transporter [Pirellulales bacterium]